MKRIFPFILAFSLLFSGCFAAKKTDADQLPTSSPDAPSSSAAGEGTFIRFSGESITVDGEEISRDPAQSVYAANDIIYYEADRGFTYGAGSAEDEHSAEEAAEHTVIHITQPGTYRLSGTLSRGQIAIDLGEEAEDDPEAVVTLILDGADIECTVAPAIIFYSVYECADADDPRMDVDTSDAGANVVIAGGSQPNRVSGSYVARIYKSYTLSEDGTEVVDNKKLHKYDGALYSKMSMNVSAEDPESGSLLILAENEGLDSEMHLTINSGSIEIISGNDGINTNEDGVSVTTINGGSLSIVVDGSTGEGDGIDSNGWIVINGGSVTSFACASSADSGIDSDNGIYINGGTVVTTGNMLDQLDGSQTYAVFSFAERQSAGVYTLKNEQGEVVAEADAPNAFTYLLFSSPELTPGTYTLWQGETQLCGAEGSFGGEPNGDGGEPPERPEGEGGDFTVVPIPNEDDGIRPEPPEVNDGFRIEPPDHSDGFEGLEPPEGFEEGMELPEGDAPGRPGGRTDMVIFPTDLIAEFSISEGANFFSFVQPLS